MPQPITKGERSFITHFTALATVPIFCTPRKIREQTAIMPIIHRASFFLFSLENSILILLYSGLII